MARVRKTFRIFDGEGDARLEEFIGRDAWALGALIQAGAAGVTPITNPAPRWSGYVYKLRNRGLDILTIDEEHGGPYSGFHARYQLRTRVEFVEAEQPANGQGEPIAAQEGAAA